MARRRGGDDSGRDELSRLLSTLRGARTQIEAAKDTGLSQSKITRAERGRFPLTVDEARRYAHALGATGEQVAHLVELTELKRTAHVRGRVSLVRVQAAIQERIGQLEDGSTLIRSWEPAAITGSLQTTDYTRALLAGDGVGTDPGPAWWAARRANIDRVREPGRTWRILVSEAALRWVLGSRRLMADQLDHLLTMSTLPNVELGVVELATPKPFVAFRGFYLYGETVASTATEVGVSFLDDPEDVQFLHTLFRGLEDAAVFGDEARTVLTRVGRAYRRA